MLTSRLSQLANRSVGKQSSGTWNSTVRPKSTLFLQTPRLSRGFVDDTSKEVERTESGGGRRHARVRRRPSVDRDLDFFSDVGFPTFGNIFRQPFGRMLTDMDRFVRPFEDIDFSPVSLVGSETLAWVPNADVTEKNDQFVVSLEVPGISKENIKIRVEDDKTLIISGEKKAETEEETGTSHRKEIVYGNFQRSWTLPENVNTKEIKANYENGVLKVNLPKTSGSVEKGVEVPIE